MITKGFNAQHQKRPPAPIELRLTPNWCWVLVLGILALLAIVFFVPCCKRDPALREPSSEGQQPTDNAQARPLPATSRGVAELVPLDISLPRPMFVGTPANIRGVGNLEKPRPQGTARLPFYVPVGTKNIAFKKPVAGSDEEPIIGELEEITNGDKEAADGSYVELAPFLQNVTIDLGAVYDIYAILFWHYHKQPRVYFDVVVQVADDPDFITNVRTLFNNDIDNSSGLGIGGDMHYVETAEGKLIDAKGARARYVRLYSNGNSSNELNHYIEVEVFGTPILQKGRKMGTLGKPAK